MEEQYKNEDILPDSHPVFTSYYYLCDGEPVQCVILGKSTVGELKRSTGAKEVRRCNMEARGLFG